MEEKFGFPLPVLWGGKLTPEILDTKNFLIFHDGDEQFVWRVTASSSRLTDMELISGALHKALVLSWLSMQSDLLLVI